MKLYLAGIKSYRLDLGIDCSAFADRRLERTIQGIKRDQNEPDRRPRSPLTRPYLLQILCTLQMSSYEDIVIQAAFTLAFAGFLRVREFTYRGTDLELGPAFSNWFLTKGSIQFIARGQHMEVALPTSKTDPFRKGMKLIIASTGDEEYPVRAMKELIEIDTHRPPPAPLFCIDKYDQ